MSEWIPDDEWKTIVRSVPIVSVDLIVQDSGGIVLGKRTNKPAQGMWFPPGGRVLKGESRNQAVHRVADQELGIQVDVVESLGAFEHIYQDAEVEGVDMKHYLANGYVVDVTNGELDSDEQHDELRVFESAPDGLHDNIEQYIDESEQITGWL